MRPTSSSSDAEGECEHQTELLWLRREVCPSEQCAMSVCLLHVLACRLTHIHRHSEFLVRPHASTESLARFHDHERATCSSTQ